MMVHKRLLYIACGIFSLFALLVFQFFRIQIIEHKKWQRRADAQHYFYKQEPFERGVFWSNNQIKKGHPEKAHAFCIDVRKFHLYVDPKSIPEDLKEEIIQDTLSFFSLKERERIRFIQQFYKESRSRKLVLWLNEKTKEKILAWWVPFAKKNRLPSNALFFVADYERLHPFSKMLGQVLHTVQATKDEREHQALPTGGLELSMDRYLRGKPGKRRFLRSPRNILETQSVVQEPVNGADVYLTINHCLQAIAEEEIERGVKVSRAKGGWAVMMDPYTGYILACAQYPFFYPDYYRLYFNKPGLIEHSKVKAIVDAYEPGSTMKPITIAIALEANKEQKRRGKRPIFDPLEKINTSKGNFPGRGKKPLTDTRLHHYLNMYLGIQKSSNIYVATLVDRIIKELGNEWYRNALARFGFGKRTGIELLGESVGKLPQLGKLHPNGKPEWSLPTPYSLAMGHNIQATSLQMLQAYAIFANGGYIVEPTLVRKVVKKQKNGTIELLFNNDEEQRKKKAIQVIDRDTVADVIKCMKGITKPGGTSPRADIWGYTEAGKSGTSMKVVQGLYSNKRHFPNFIGFAPVTKPVFVLFVGLDEPVAEFVPGIGLNHFGGKSAAPIFREIGRRTLEYLGIPQDDPHGYPTNDPRYNAVKADWVLEAEKLRKLYEEWNNS